MNIVYRFTQIKERFVEIWRSSLIFKSAVILHIGYFSITLVLVLTVLRSQNDFLIYWKAGGVFLENVNDLYNQEHYIWDFRYLPLSAVLFIPFFVLGFDLGFVIFHFLNLTLNIVICILIYKIIMLVKGEGHETDDNRVILYISLYLMSAPHVLNYILGQINLYVAFFILLSLFIFLKYESYKWQFVGSLILGISIVVKPSAIFIIPFLMIIHFDLKNKIKIIDLPKSLIRIFGAIVPIALNLVLFIAFPPLFDGFIRTNFTGSNPLTLNYSFSITKNILNFCYLFNIPYNQLYVLIAVIAIIVGLSLVVYIFGKSDRFTIIYGFTLSLMIILLVYYDSWNHHLLILAPLLIIVLFNMPRQSNATLGVKRAFFFFIIFDIAFMGVWFLTFIYFPFNFGSTIFLLVTFFEIAKYRLGFSKNGIPKEIEVKLNEV